MNTYSDILDNQILQDLQDSYVSTLPVYAWCYGRPFRQLTHFSGNEEEEAFFNAHISEETKKIILASFSDGDAENVILADADIPCILLCGIAIRDNAGRALGAWIFAGICMERLSGEEGIPKGAAFTTTVEYDHIITLIAKTSGLYFAAHGRSVTADEKLSGVSTTEEELADERARSEAIGGILTMIESENDFGQVVSDILSIAGEYMQLSDALLLRLDAADRDVDVVSDYAGDEEHSIIGHFLKMTREEIPFLTGREYTVSSDSIMPDTFRNFFRKYGITAGVFLPLTVDGQTQMYVCFVMRHAARKWKLKELAFLNEVKCVIHALLSARMRDNSLAGAYATLDGVLENGAEGLVVAQRGGEEYIYANEQFGRMITDPKDRQNFHDYVNTLMDKEVTDAGYFADASKRWYNVHSAPLRWVDGRSVRLVTLYDVTETKRYEQKIEEQAKTDYLTGLYNRQQFERDLAIAMKDASRGGEQGSFLYINLDDFKDVNGEYGHSLGDALLKEAARALGSICKTSATCYRIGGDEFGVLVPFYENTALDRLVGTIRRRFEQSWSLEGKEYLCNMSMGVVCFPKDGADMKTLMQHADIALDAAKEKAPGIVEWYSERSDKSDPKRTSLEKALRAAAEEGCRDFNAEYEPLLLREEAAAARDGIPAKGAAEEKNGLPAKDAAAAKNGLSVKSAAAAKGTKPEGNAATCIGAKAHIRWKSKEPLAAEEEIISAAESLGVVETVDYRILEDACRHCRYWNDFGEPGYRIYVALSPQTLLSMHAPSRIRGILDETGINPKNVLLGPRSAVALREEDRLRYVSDEIIKTGVAFLREGEWEAAGARLSGTVLTAAEFEERYMS